MSFCNFLFENKKLQKPNQKKVGGTEWATVNFSMANVCFYEPEVGVV